MQSKKSKGAKSKVAKHSNRVKYELECVQQSLNRFQIKKEALEKQLSAALLSESIEKKQQQEKIACGIEDDLYKLSTQMPALDDYSGTQNTEWKKTPEFQRLAQSYKTYPRYIQGYCAYLNRFSIMHALVDQSTTATYIPEGTRGVFHNTFDIAFAMGHRQFLRDALKVDASWCSTSWTEGEEGAKRWGMYRSESPVSNVLGWGRPIEEKEYFKARHHDYAIARSDGK